MGVATPRTCACLRWGGGNGAPAKSGPRHAAPLGHPVCYGSASTSSYSLRSVHSAHYPAVIGCRHVRDMDVIGGHF